MAARILNEHLELFIDLSDIAKNMSIMSQKELSEKDKYGLVLENFHEMKEDINIVVKFDLKIPSLSLPGILKISFTD